MASDFQCSFCGRPRSDVRKLISGPQIFVCDACVSTFVELATEGTAAAREPPAAIALVAGGEVAHGSTSKCNFCGKARRDTRFSYVHEDDRSGKLSICHECVGLCIDILAEALGDPWEAHIETWPGVLPPSLR
jgi:ATP-dependent protease Clp ATPase subunit